MKILATGATGFIGSHLIKRLIEEKHQIIIVHRKSSSFTHLEKFRSAVSFIEVNSLDQIPTIFKRFTIEGIIHLAATYIKHHKNNEDVILMNKSNIDFPSVLLNEAIQNKVKFFINTGTCFEYQESMNPIDENSPISPYNYYAATKISFEEILKFFVKISNIRATTLKLFFPYGENDKERIIQTMIRSMCANTPLSIETTTQKLSFTYVGDVVDAYVKAIAFLTSRSYKKYETFNIGNPTPTGLKDISQTLEMIHASKSLLTFKKPSSGIEITHMTCDATKSQNMLDWRPQTSLKNGLEKTYNSLKH